MIFVFVFTLIHVITIVLSVIYKPDAQIKKDKQKFQELLQKITTC